MSFKADILRLNVYGMAGETKLGDLGMTPGRFRFEPEFPAFPEARIADYNARGNVWFGRMFIHPKIVTHLGKH